MFLRLFLLVNVDIVPQNVNEQMSIIQKKKKNTHASEAGRVHFSSESTSSFLALFSVSNLLTTFVAQT